jgi:hypothetical protein
MAIERGSPGILEFPCDVERLENGNTLISDAGDENGSGSEIIEVDYAGNIVWRYAEGLRFAHSAKRLSDSNTLISDTNNDRFIIVSPDCEIVFTTDSWGGGTGMLSDGSHLRYPNDVHMLSDGSFLITDRNNDRCLIADREGNVRWQYNEGIKHPHNCDMLPNGNVMIADSDGHRVIEVNRDKEIVWQFGGPGILNWPRDADRLENGNTLIADSRNSRVIEVTPDGKIAWEYQADHFANFYDADKLPNGNVLMAHQQRQQVIEVNPAGMIVWQYRNYIQPNAILPRLKNGSFKDRGVDGAPLHWTLCKRFSEGGGELIWDPEATPRPAPGLSFDRAGALYIQQTVSVTPGELYRMAATVRCEGMAEGRFAYLQMSFLDTWGGLVQDASLAPKGNFFTGTTDWTEDSFEAIAPPQACAVSLRLVMTGAGKAWVKGLMFMA